MTSRLLERVTVTPYDSLIIAAGADQSYFGNDQFAEYAPGMKTIDHALELRGRILGAFEQAELSDDPVEREKLLTFVVIGAGPTGVEMAGQIAEMAERTLKGSFRHIDPTKARVILLDAAPAVLTPFGPKLSAKAQKRLEKLGVEIQLNAMVTNLDYDGIEVKDSDGTVRRIEAQCKVWSAGVQASSLGKVLAEETGVELDRAGRVKVGPDLTVPGHTNVFVAGDMMAVDGVPGVAQGAIQGGRYAADAITAGLRGQTPDQRKPFVLRQGLDGHDFAVRRGHAGSAPVYQEEVRDRGLLRLARLACAAPGVPGRLPQPIEHLHQLVLRVHHSRPYPACGDRATGLRPHGDGRALRAGASRGRGDPGEARPSPAQAGRIVRFGTHPSAGAGAHVWALASALASPTTEQARSAGARGPGPATCRRSVSCRPARVAAACRGAPASSGPRSCLRTPT